MGPASVRRVDFGYFVRPAAETETGNPRVEPCLGYVIDHAQGRLLFDTGLGADPQVDAHYRPRRIELPDALGAVQLTLSDIDLAANCHLHFDHCGGNPRLGDIPVFVQTVELQSARTTDGLHAAGPHRRQPIRAPRRRSGDLARRAPDSYTGTHGRAPVAGCPAAGWSGRRGRSKPRHRNAVRSRPAVLAGSSRQSWAAASSDPGVDGHASAVRPADRLLRSRPLGVAPMSMRALSRRPP